MKSKLLFITFLLIPILGFSQIFEENFSDYLNLENDGWVRTNLSEPLGPLNWFPGNIAAFESHSGAPDAYIAASYENTAATGGIISNWLISPTVEVKDGDVLSFWTRVPENSEWNDRLEVRSSLGQMTVPSEDEEDVGSFDNLELVINDDYDLSYPEEWTKYEIVVSGAGSTPTAMNFAFRYNLDNTDGTDGNFIGIDDVKIEAAAVEEEPCEWTVKVWSYETFGDETTWELRDEEGVILSGGPYEITYTDEQSITASGPVEFYINTIGDTNDNEANYKIYNETGVLIEGHIEAGEEATYSDMSCEDEGEPEEEPQYCQPYLDCTGDDMITNVNFLEIDNDSECSPEGYGDYTDQIANVVAGETYPISVTVSDGWNVESVSVWIDFDQSDTFDEEEFFYIGTGSDEVLTSEISIPAGLEQDEYRMRVRVAAVGEEFATWDMACNTDDQLFGETEDYTVSVGEMSIGDSNKIDFTYYPNPVEEVLNIQADQEVESAAVYNLLGQEVFQSKANNNQIQLETLSAGMYMIEIHFNEGSSEIFRIVKK